MLLQQQSDMLMGHSNGIREASTMCVAVYKREGCVALSLAGISAISKVTPTYP